MAVPFRTYAQEMIIPAQPFSLDASDTDWRLHVMQYLLEQGPRQLVARRQAAEEAARRACLCWAYPEELSALRSLQENRRRVVLRMVGLRALRALERSRLTEAMGILVRWVRIHFLTEGVVVEMRRRRTGRAVWFLWRALEEWAARNGRLPPAAEVLLLAERRGRRLIAALLHEWRARAAVDRSHRAAAVAIRSQRRATVLQAWQVTVGEARALQEVHAAATAKRQLALRMRALHRLAMAAARSTPLPAGTPAVLYRPFPLCMLPLLAATLSRHTSIQVDPVSTLEKPAFYCYHTLPAYHLRLPPSSIPSSRFASHCCNAFCYTIHPRPCPGTQRLTLDFPRVWQAQPEREGQAEAQVVLSR